MGPKRGVNETDEVEVGGMECEPGLFMGIGLGCGVWALV